MSCKKCEKSHKAGSGKSGIYYKWEDTTIFLVGCEKHLKEIFDVLDKAQKKQ